MIHAPRREPFLMQIERTYVLTLAGVFITVLLWYWMIVPLASPDVWPLLEVPATLTGRRAPEQERDLYISVDARSRLFLNQHPITAAALVQELQAKSKWQRQVFVRVDRSAKFGAVREVIRIAQRAGEPRLTFLARPSLPKK